ncbi:MAG: ribosomal-processing cysteine protease Prp [Clostridia bacterium]|nr:ribosomal-processing cysteine protease Prp [Clostridia bacterium]
MTEITYTRYPKACLTINGHSDAVRTNGHDLCCAAVSMLVCTFMKRLEDLNLKDKAIYCGDGYARGEFTPRGKEARRGLEAIDTILTGFRLLREQYPENIIITGGKK